MLAVKQEQEIDRAADIWRETLELIDSVSARVQTLVTHHPGSHAALGPILEIRNAAADMLALYE